MQARRYGAMLAMVESGKRPERPIGERISLEQSIAALMNMDEFRLVGVSMLCGSEAARLCVDKPLLDGAGFLASP